MKVLSIAIVAALATAASADSQFAVLANPKASWTYDVVAGHKHKATHVKATIAVTAVHTVGPYTVIELETTYTPASTTYSIEMGTWIVGPDGLREVLFFRPTEDGGYSEKHIADAYGEHHVPRAYVPATPPKSKVHWKLERFGDEDRTYNVSAAFTKPDAHTWRTAWKGTFVIPETGDKNTYTWSTDFDPAIGLTQICTESNYCLRLAPSAP